MNVFNLLKKINENSNWMFMRQLIFIMIWFVHVKKYIMTMLATIDKMSLKYLFLFCPRREDFVCLKTIQHFKICATFSEATEAILFESFKYTKVPVKLLVLPLGNELRQSIELHLNLKKSYLLARKVKLTKFSVVVEQATNESLWTMTKMNDLRN